MTLADSAEKILPGGKRREEVEKDIAAVVEAISGRDYKNGITNASAMAAQAVLSVFERD
jgi:hypothetical protein